MIYDGIGVWFGLLFLAVAVGFGWGRRHGRRDGFLEGIRFAPLELRRASLEQARCVVCGRGACPAGDSAQHSLDSQRKEPL